MSPNHTHTHARARARARTHARMHARAGGYANGYEELCPSKTAKTTKCLKVAAWVVSPKNANMTCSPTLCAAAAKVRCTPVFTSRVQHWWMPDERFA